MITSFYMTKPLIKIRLLLWGTPRIRTSSRKFSHEIILFRFKEDYLCYDLVRGDYFQKEVRDMKWIEIYANYNMSNLSHNALLTNNFSQVMVSNNSTNNHFSLCMAKLGSNVSLLNCILSILYSREKGNS